MDGAEVYELAKPHPLLDRRDPLAIALEFVAAHYTLDGNTTMVHWRGDTRVWRDGAYVVVEDAKLRSHVYRFLENAERPGPKGTTEPFQPNSRIVSDVIDALRAATYLDGTLTPPTWLKNFPDTLDPTNLLPAPNGLLNLEDGALLPHQLELFATSALTIEIDSDSPTPTQLLGFLAELFPDDPQAIATLQEIFGYLLTTDTDQQKILMLVGPKRSGKGTLARVLMGLLGRDNVVNPTFASMSNNFGLAPLIDKRLAIISDARLSARSDQAVIAERLLSISGEDGQTIDRKFREPWQGKLQTRFLILTNELPRLSDSSGALASRFILLTLTRSFLGKEDHGLTDRLLTELPGILNWALEGLQRLRQRGHFIQPKSSAGAITELEDLASPVGAFIRDCCLVGPGQSVPIDDMFDAWKLWCERQGRKPGTKQTFGRDLRAAIPNLKITQPREEGVRQRVYEGVAIVALIPK